MHRRRRRTPIPASPKHAPGKPGTESRRYIHYTMCRLRSSPRPSQDGLSPRAWPKSSSLKYVGLHNFQQRKGIEGRSHVHPSPCPQPSPSYSFPPHVPARRLKYKTYRVEVDRSNSRGKCVADPTRRPRRVYLRVFSSRRILTVSVASPKPLFVGCPGGPHRT